MCVLNGKDIRQLILPTEQSEKVHSFFLSEKLFSEKTKNKLLPETPFPVHHANMSDAIHELEVGNSKEELSNQLFFK